MIQSQLEAVRRRAEEISALLSHGDVIIDFHAALQPMRELMDSLALTCRSGAEAGASGDAADGIWRTINGTPVYIKDGESLGDAIKEKFDDEGGGRTKTVRTDESGKVTHGPKKMIGHITAEPGEYHHGTGASNVDSILKHGIAPTDKTLGFPAAYVGGKSLAQSYGAGRAIRNGDKEVAVFVINHKGGQGLYRPPSAKGLGYTPHGIKPSQIDRIEYYSTNGGRDEKPIRVEHVKDGKRIATP